MKKFILCLGLTLLLAGVAGLGDIQAAEYYPWPSESGSGYCYEYPYAYCDYYYAPYADPYTQYFYYGIPDYDYGYGFEGREEGRRGREGYEGREYEGGRRR